MDTSIQWLYFVWQHGPYTHLLEVFIVLHINAYHICSILTLTHHEGPSLPKTILYHGIQVKKHINGTNNNLRSQKCHVFLQDLSLSHELCHRAMLPLRLWHLGRIPNHNLGIVLTWQWDSLIFSNKTIFVMEFEDFLNKKALTKN